MYTLEKPTKMNKSEKRQQQQQRNDIVYMWVLRRSQAQNRKTAANKESECVNEWADKKYQKWKYTLSLAQTHTHTQRSTQHTHLHISEFRVFVCFFFSSFFPYSASFFILLLIMFYWCFSWTYVFSRVVNIDAHSALYLALFASCTAMCVSSLSSPFFLRTLYLFLPPSFFFALSQNTIIL